MITNDMADKEMIEEKIGEALGLEKAAQKEVEGLIESDDLDSEKIESTADETAEKVSKIMETYLGEDPDTQEALEFLCLAEGGEVTHYEVLASIAKEVSNKKFGTTVRAILKEEQGHLQLCTKLAKINVAAA